MDFSCQMLFSVDNWTWKHITRFNYVWRNFNAIELKIEREKLPITISINWKVVKVLILFLFKFNAKLQSTKRQKLVFERQMSSLIEHDDDSADQAVKQA